MTDWNPYEDGKGLVGGRARNRVGKRNVPPVIHPYVLRPVDVPDHMSAGRDFFKDRVVEVEVGFARGHFLRDRIRQAPDHHFLGFEIRRRWCDRMARFLDREGITNTRVILEDARALLLSLLAEGSVSAFYVFFPDPWWKKRHHKKRIMSEPTVQVFHRLLRPGGSLHLRTDVQAYAELVTELLENHGGFDAGPQGRTLDDDVLPLTHREKKCEEAGVDVFSMHFVKRAGSL